MYLKNMSSEMKIKFLDSIFYYKSFFVGGVVMGFSWFELTASMSTVEFLSFYFFNQYCTPIMITGICLEDSFSFSWNF